ncbi:helix-turn-helix domain-containing protein [Shinella curvata]|uniref:Helix-turn-helix domain-containing protein n=1 Tax=Shinella curvata TaxID=1817964 RepID=A0ABT8XM09_9HYPH|nr:helix-turn-helix domain-containing protein [Shinella curvata]MCJ8055807.1 helix-turn-helix domain-containing protein [Shinella curvata]MDO6124771.1 helix-turn-helix domain-containing protein [Shinella curvata]
MIKAAQNAPALRIGFVLAKRFTLSAMALFVDTLRLAADQDDGSRKIRCDWDVLSHGRGFVTSSCGVQVASNAELIDPRKYTHIVVVGGLLKVEEPLDAAMTNYLRKAAQTGVGLVGLCTGSFLLAEAGLLKNHTACVSWLHHKEFTRRFPHLKVTSEQIFNLDDRLATCAGGSASADLAAALVRRHIGESAERNATEILQISHRREATDAQARKPLGIEVGDRRVHQTLLLMEQHMEDVLPVGALATLIGLSRRQLERLFLECLEASPSAIYLRLRLESARRMMVDEPKRPLIDIALANGFSGPSHFSIRFRAHFAISPTEARHLDSLGKMKSQTQ